MKLTVLADNNTLIDRYYLGEPALSFFIEDAGERFLFDTGYSDVYLRNASALGMRVEDADAIVLSHGHNDHTGGLAYLPHRPVPFRVIAHPAVFEPKMDQGLAVGSPMDRRAAEERFSLDLTKETYKLTPRLTFLGEIPRTTEFENQTPVGKRLTGDLWQDDYVLDDSALVYEGTEGIYIISGCSHSGICNIISYAKRITGRDRVLGVIGGFHLMEENSRQLEGTCAYFKKERIAHLYPCHCTCFYAKAAIQTVSPVQEIGVGSTLEWV